MSIEVPKVAPKKESIENIHERLKTIIRTVSGDYGINVVSKLPEATERQIRSEGMDPDNSWLRVVEFNKKTSEIQREYVYIPPNIYEASEDIAKGKAAHEAAHVAITRTEHFHEEVPRIPGFKAIEAAAEERPTDQYVRKVLPGAGEWVDSARRDSVVQAETFKTKRLEQMGMSDVAIPIPKFAQLSSLITYAPHYTEEELERTYDREVLDVYEGIREEIEKVEHTLPEDRDNEDVRIAEARERLRIIEEEVWPKVEELAKKDLNNEAERQFMDWLRSKSPADLDEILRELLKELVEYIDSMPTQCEEKNEGEGEAGSEEPSEGMVSSPLSDDLPEELKEKLQEAFDNLDDETKKQFEGQAHEELEKIESNIVDETKSGISSDEGVEVDKPTPPDDEVEGGSVDFSKVEEQIHEAEKDLEARLASMHETKTRYDTIYEEVRELEDRLYRQLDEIFYPNIKSAITLKSAGSTINLPALFRWEAARAAGSSSIDNRIFESHITPETRDYAFTLLVDLSGSMHGVKIQEAFRGVVMLTEALGRVGVTCEILGFQDKIIVFKAADEKMSDDVRNRIAGMELETSNANPGGNNRADGNDDGPCVREASDRLAELPQRVKFLTVISDGQPAGYRSTEQDLHDTVAYVIESTDQHLLGLGLGWGTDHVTQYYPNAIPNIDSNNFPDVLAKVLIDTMQNPNKY